MARVDGKTRVYAVLGHPVGHTLSPLMQNAAFRAAGMNAVYVAFEVPPARIEESLRGLHAAAIAGLNITLPHKEAVFRLLSSRTEEAAEIEAANTLLWEEAGWRGHATDGHGFAAWTAECGIEITGRRVLVLGAGGAARAVVRQLVSLEASEIAVVSRTVRRAADLAESSARSARGRVAIRAAALGDDPAAFGVPPWDLLVRALAAEEVASEEGRWWRSLSKPAPILDLNYAERAEGTRAMARTQGRRFEDGKGLLLHQGAASFEFWTREKAPLAAMRAALAEA